MKNQKEKSVVGTLFIKAELVRGLYKNILYYWYNGSFHRRWEVAMPNGLEPHHKYTPAWACICNTTTKNTILDHGTILEKES